MTGVTRQSRIKLNREASFNTSPLIGSLSDTMPHEPLDLFTFLIGKAQTATLTILAQISYWYILDHEQRCCGIVNISGSSYEGGDGTIKISDFISHVKVREGIGII